MWLYVTDEKGKRWRGAKRAIRRNHINTVPTCTCHFAGDLNWVWGREHYSPHAVTWFIQNTEISVGGELLILWDLLQICFWQATIKPALIKWMCVGKSHIYLTAQFQGVQKGDLALIKERGNMHYHLLWFLKSPQNGWMEDKLFTEKKIGYPPSGGGRREKIVNVILGTDAEAKEDEKKLTVFPITVRPSRNSISFCKETSSPEGKGQKVLGLVLKL